jgi:hypothetical protein
MKRIEPIYTSDALTFGKLIHSCLEAFYNGKSYRAIINKNYLDTKDKRQVHYKVLALALMKGYTELYAEQDINIKILSTELEYECPIINPLTGRRSRKYNLHGFIDMAAQDHDGIWLWEHKTTSTLNDGYIKRIWHDQQTMLYVIAYELMYNVKVKGIVYNAIQKAQLRQGKKESLSDFAGRLKKRYLTDSSMFHREKIFIDPRRKKEVEKELWQITQDMGRCKDFYKNRSQCYIFGECEFFKICNSNDNPLIIQNYYKERENVTNREKQEENKPF